MPAVERSTELRLPTVTIRVRIALANHEPVAADLFVADASRTGRSELLDDVAAMLDEPSLFVPLRDDHGVRLFAKHAIAWISVNRHDDAGTFDFADIPSEVITLYDREHRVEIELVTGDKLVGAMLDSAPADRPRVVDHLNRAGSFVRLWTSEQHYLVNKLQILHVTELTE